MTDDIRELALRLARQALDRNKFTELTYTRCKDGIDLDEPTTDLVDLVRLAIAEGRRMWREEMSRAASDVLAERERQISVEGWTPEHDDKHSSGEMARAAACYARFGTGHNVPFDWPWANSWWKPRDPRRNLVRSAALLLAEIERIDRATTQSMGEG